jgi:hypothetical protein
VFTSDVDHEGAGRCPSRCAHYAVEALLKRPSVVVQNGLAKMFIVGEWPV